MNEKTLNSLMEDFTVLYETRPYLEINDYYTSKSGMTTVLHVGHFGSLMASYITKLEQKYGLTWAIAMSLSIDGDIPIVFI